MSSILGTLLSFLASLIKVPLTHIIAFFVGKSAGRKDVEAEQNRNNLDAIAAADDARGGVKHDADSVRDDPFNRDNA